MATFHNSQFCVYFMGELSASWIVSGWDAVVALVNAELHICEEWRHNAGFICCGTLRIAQQDFDTDPSDEFKTELLDWICKMLNAAQHQQPSPDAAITEEWLREIGGCDECGSLTFGDDNGVRQVSVYRGKVYVDKRSLDDCGVMSCNAFLSLLDALGVPTKKDKEVPNG